jgi:hypothetical protein
LSLILLELPVQGRTSSVVFLLIPLLPEEPDQLFILNELLNYHAEGYATLGLMAGSFVELALLIFVSVHRTTCYFGGSSKIRVILDLHQDLMNLSTEWREVEVFKLLLFLYLFP